MFKLTNFMFVGTKVILEFNDGYYRVFNLLDYLEGKKGPVIDEIFSTDSGYKKVSIVDGTLEWFNGYDIDPEILYEESEKFIL